MQMVQMQLMQKMMGGGEQAEIMQMMQMKMMQKMMEGGEKEGSERKEGEGMKRIEGKLDTLTTAMTGLVSVLTDQFGGKRKREQQGENSDD